MARAEHGPGYCVRTFLRFPGMSSIDRFTILLVEDFDDARELIRTVDRILGRPTAHPETT